LHFGFHFDCKQKTRVHRSTVAARRQINDTTKAVRSPPARHIIENAVVRLLSSSFSLDVADGHLLGLMLRPRRLFFT
jgi:hypothetical protein